MKEINEKLYAIKSSMRERDRIKDLAQRCEAQKSELEEKRSFLLNQLKKEELDVQKLEGLSIVGLVHLIKGDKEEKLDQEKREVLSAKLKYDEACKDIDNLNNEILNLKYKISEFNELDDEYNSLIIEKQILIKSQIPDMNEKFHYLMEEKVEILSKQKEIKEAIVAGEKLMISLKSVEQCLNSASNWGVYDMFGGGIFATMAKHDRIDEARANIDIAQSHLRKFHRELSDIGEVINIDLEMDSFLSFADYFFDGFFVDWAVQSKIDDALGRTEQTIDSVSKLILGLDKSLKDSDEMLRKLEQKRLRMIEEI